MALKLFVDFKFEFSMKTWPFWPELKRPDFVRFAILKVYGEIDDPHALGKESLVIRDGS